MNSDPLGPVVSLAIVVGSAMPFEAAIGLYRPDVGAIFVGATDGCGFFASVPVDAAVGLTSIKLIARANGREEVFRFPESLEVSVPRDPFVGFERRMGGWQSHFDGVFDLNGLAAEVDDEGIIVIPERASQLRLWAIDIATARGPRAIVVRKGGRYLRVDRPEARDDVAELFGFPLGQRCGFSVPLIAGSVGVEEIVIDALSYDRSVATLGTVKIRQTEPMASDVLPRRAKLSGAIDALTLDGCSVDTASGIAIRPGQMLGVRGWVIDRTGPRLAGGVELIFDGGCARSGQTSVQRDDVASQVGLGVSACGFELEFVLGALEQGEHTLSVRGFGARRDAIGELATFRLRHSTHAEVCS